MHRKNIYKIGLSLLIALAFILPTASVLAVQGEEEKASVNTEVDSGISINNLGAQQPGPVYILGMTEPVLGGPDGNAITGGCTPITIMIQNEPGFGPATVKAFVDIYKKSTGVEVLMYETSFEDNFDIYNNWVQIDADCGLIGGQYDSWSWSDARAYCDTHSMKSTMYEIYKGNQDDYLQCTKSFDVSEQDGISVEFVTWVQGDYNSDSMYVGISPFDYLDFEIGDDTGAWQNPWDPIQSYFFNWQDGVYGGYYYPQPHFLQGSYYFFDTSWDIYNYRNGIDYTNYVQALGNNWWLVHLNLTKADLLQMGLNIYDIMFRFSWHTDPEFQYEGAYVDCFKVYSIEKMEEKVFQSHSQGEFIIPEGCTNFTFPMEWCPEAGDKDNTYDIRLWLEAVDPLHVSTTDWMDYADIMVVVTNWFDIEVTCLQIESSFDPGWQVNTCDPLIPDEATFEYGSDLHILATIHADGTLPATNIPVTASAYKKVMEELLFTDFEGLNPFTQLYGEAHITTQDAWSGTKSLGFFTEAYSRYLPTDTFSYAICGLGLDFSNNAKIWEEHYWKGLTEGTSDFACPIIMDNHHNTLLGTGASTTTGQKMAGYQPDWIGPQQPSCRYQRADLTYLWNRYYNLGYLRDGNGLPLYESNLGFAWSADGDAINYNAVAVGQGILWSGVFIDDVRIISETISEDAIWTDTIIIPGPLEPCETAQVQFEFENIPYCNYLIQISTNAPGACGNLGDATESAQIHVYQDLERASDKEMETIDYTAIDNGVFGISSSDYDNYIASNADYHRYISNQDSVMQLCPGGEKCIDVTAGMLMYFDAWYEIEDGWDRFTVEIAPCADTHTWLDWQRLDITWPDLFVADQITGYSATDAHGLGSLPVDDGWYAQANGEGLFVDLSQYGTGPMEVRIHFDSDAGTEFRGIKLDDFSIPALLVDGVPFFDPADNLDNWCPQAPWSYGSFWTYDALLDQWCWFAPIAAPYNDGLIWSTEITDAFAAEFCFTYNNALTAGMVTAEISADGGATWYEICRFTPTYRFGVGTYCYDLSPYVGQNILIRFVAQPNTYIAGTVVSGLFCIYDLEIMGKKDSMAPVTSMTMSGTMKESGWYTTPVKVTITAVDLGGAGMGEIHYILDGVEKVVAGNKAEFTVSGNGEHTLTYWGVDAVGNVETPKHTAPSFRIDSGAKPTVSITAPTPGIYIMGKKIMSSSNTIIIGGFTAEATAADADSGIYRVTFYLDGNAVADDTTAPYSAYICSKHMGAATLKVVAEDFAQNTAEAEMTLKYFKFF